LSDFISSPHSPFKSLIRLLLRHIVVGQLTYIAPCRHLKPVAPGAHLAHGTEQRTQSGGQERWTDPTVETSMRPVAGPLCAPSCACLVGARAWRGISSWRPSRRQVENPCSAGALRPTGQYGRRRIAARRRSSAPRAAGGTGRALLLFTAGLPLGGWLWVLRDDRNGSSRPGGPEASVTRIEHELSGDIAA
jgi:hypothetical protein